MGGLRVSGIVHRVGWRGDRASLVQGESRRSSSGQPADRSHSVSPADLKPGSQNIASAGISQYTVYEAPNNTLIVQPSGGGMPPPPQQPPQMIAQSPPLDMQMMGGGVSEMDIVKTLNTVQLFTDLTTT